MKFNNKTIIKKDGKCKLYFNDDEELIDILNEFESHLCFYCANGYPSKCPKIHDLDPNILKYDFIDKGYEIFDKNEVYKILRVSKCNNYVADNTKNPYSTIKKKNILLK